MGACEGRTREIVGSNPTPGAILLVQLMSKFPMDEISEVFFHSGAAYRKYFTELLESDGIKCVAPLGGLGLGKQKASYLKAQQVEYHVRS